MELLAAYLRTAADPDLVGDEVDEEAAARRLAGRYCAADIIGAIFAIQRSLEQIEQGLRGSNGERT